MPDNPISNPATPPIQPTPGYGPEKPSLAGEERERPFMLEPEKTTPQGEAAAEKPSPMEIAGDAARQQQPMPQEELSSQIEKLHNQLGNIRTNLQNPTLTKNFVPDHYTAMEKVVQKMNPDMNTIAKSTQGKFEPAQKTPGTGVLDFVTNWVGGAQNTLSGALSYLQTTDKPDVTNYLRLQYAVQRASQRGELFASILGSSVSGIKTIMSTQLG
jgi:hypothetical protein